MLGWPQRPVGAVDVLVLGAQFFALVPMPPDHVDAGTHPLEVDPGSVTLVQTTAGTWITRPPARCPNGHPLGPNQVLVGHVACLGHGGGHTSWHCRVCDAVVYGPPLNTHCTTLEGPAAVRISTHPS
jgi:hypothetical protein